MLRTSLSAAVLAAVCCATPTPTKETASPAPPLPQVEGTLPVAGLSSPVRVVRDRWGIPHITAESQDDLFLAQGFVQAQDRLFQMDLWRRSVQGRLAEVLGANFIERDAMTRRIQYRGSAEREWASYGPDAQAIAASFTQGVNAWIALTRDRLPEEFALAGWTPEPWRAEDLLTRTDAFATSRGAAEELLRARLAHLIGVAAAHRYLPPGEQPGAIAAGDVDLGAVNSLVGDMLHRVGAPPFFAGLAGPVVGRLRAEIASGDILPAPERRLVDEGSAWSLAPSRTSTGAPIVASLSLTPLDHPSARYLVHLKAPGWNVAGVTSPWLPGVVAGHNERVAWSFVVAPTDTQDVFVERLNPANPRERLTPDGWRPITVAREPVIVKGRGEPFEYEQQFTPNGTVMAIDRQRHLAYAVAWTGREPGGAAELGALSLGRAKTWSEFQASLARWKLPVAEFAYADVDGHVGRQSAGLIPVRAAGGGTLPTPGWTAGRRWRGWVPHDRLPSAHDRPEGQMLISPGPARRRRLEALLTGPPVGPDAVRRIQLDLVSGHAQQLIPLLAAVTAPQPEVESARRRLLEWDRRMRSDAVVARLFVAWEEALVTALAAARIPSSLVAEFVPRATSHLVDAVLDADKTWFDGDRPTARDRLLLETLATAVDEVKQPVGASVAVPWSRFRTASFSHPLAVSPQAARRFNVGPFHVPGSADTVSASAPAISGRTIAPTVRLMIDLADWDRSRAVIVPGQSGAPDSPHFADLADAWANGEDVPLVFSESAVAAAAESTLILRPPP